MNPASRIARPAQITGRTLAFRGLVLPGWFPFCPRCRCPVERSSFTGIPGSERLTYRVECHGSDRSIEVDLAAAPGAMTGLLP